MKTPDLNTNSKPEADSRPLHGMVSRVVRQFVSFDFRAGNPLQKLVNWDFKLWKLSVSVCGWRSHKVGVAWSWEWPQQGGNYWYRWYLKMGGEWKLLRG